tara:strand:+ start:195 stop:566 length:372 start_codon:yes stop_codon:yes gene_type:complete
MPKSKIRAKIKFNNQQIEVGYYDTKAQAEAAKNAARQALEKWEELNPPKPPEKKRLPSLNTLVHFINQGTYDKVIEEIAETALSRYHLIKRHNYRVDKFPTSNKVKNVSYLNRTKRQALSAHL